MSLDLTDPRVVRTREAIFRAALEILDEEGAAGITHQRVAERAGIGRATVYRHWPQPHDLLGEVIDQLPIPFLDAPGPTLRTRLQQTLRHMRDELSVPIMRTTLSSMIERSHHDEQVRATRDAKLGVIRERLRTGLADAVRDGELAGRPDAEEMLAALLGPLTFRLLMEGRPASDAFVDSVVDAALAPFLP